MDKNHRDAELTRKNARLGLTVLAIVFTMVGVSFAAVPLYDLFCRVTGFSGTTQVAASLPDQVVDRKITVKFNADTDRNLPWIFRPEEREIDIYLGQQGLTAYYAKNRTAKPVSGTALYNVTPLKAGKYFHKIQCFCFDNQTLQPGQEMTMPVMFFVDPALHDDPNMDDVRAITLSYTFYKSQTQELDSALEAFYNSGQQVIN